MAYQVFARKYRPQTFADVIGQDHVTKTLANAIKLGRLAQAYLFVGPRGTGKTSTARIVAKALNCSDGPKVDFDPNEEICREIAEGRCLDVLEIDGASNNGVEQVRDLRDNVRYAPIKGRFKIYIIDEVHMLSTAAFNALLKTLEEPPAHVKFIFATTEAHKLPATILSRCQRFDLRRISDSAIATHLQKICDLEKVKAEPAALNALARYAEGGLRDAESALDQVIGFFGDRVAEAEVLTMFGLTGFQPIVQLMRSILQSDMVSVLKLSHELVVEGKDLGKLSQDILRLVRNLIIYQISPEALENEMTEDQKTAMQELSGAVSRAALMTMMEELSHLENRLRYALAKDVVFEVALMQLCQLKEKVSLETVLQQLTAGQGANVSPVSSTSSESRAETAFSNRSSLAAPVSVAVTALVANPQKIWEEIVEKFAKERPLEAETIRATRFMNCKGDLFEIALPPALKNKLAYLTNARNLPLLEQYLADACGRKIKIAFLLIEPKSAPADMKPEPVPIKISQQDFEEDPLIHEALEMFQAKIVRPN